MIKDYPKRQVKDAAQCLAKCNSDSPCKFWDFGGGWCRLRSNSGRGLQSDSGYFYGSKNCKFKGK